MAEKFLLHRFIVALQIKRFEDLKGKRVAISGFGTLTDTLTREILIDRGRKPMQDVMPFKRRRCSGTGRLAFE